MTTQLHELLTTGQVRLQPGQHGRVNAVVPMAQQQTVAYRIESRGRPKRFSFFRPKNKKYQKTNFIFGPKNKRKQKDPTFSDENEK